MDDGDAAVGAEVRVRVADRRLAVSCPAGVADADGAIQRLTAEQLGHVVQLTNDLALVQRISVNDGYAG